MSCNQRNFNQRLNCFSFEQSKKASNWLLFFYLFNVVALQSAQRAKHFERKPKQKKKKQKNSFLLLPVAKQKQKKQQQQEELSITILRACESLCLSFFVFAALPQLRTRMSLRERAQKKKNKLMLPACTQKQSKERRTENGTASLRNSNKHV